MEIETKLKDIQSEIKPLYEKGIGADVYNDIHRKLYLKERCAIYLTLRERQSYLRRKYAPLDRNKLNAPENLWMNDYKLMDFMNLFIWGVDDDYI